MVYIKTSLYVIDNSGGRKVSCINIKNKSYRSCGNIGDMLLVSMKKISRKNKVKVGTLYNCLIVGRKKVTKRLGSSLIKFDSNLVIILNNNNLPLGTRILGPVGKELRKKKYLKVVALAPLII